MALGVAVDRYDLGAPVFSVYKAWVVQTSLDMPVRLGMSGALNSRLYEELRRPLQQPIAVNYRLLLKGALNV